MQATMAYGNMEVQLQLFLTWIFSAGHWSPSQLWTLYCLGKSLQYPFNNRMSRNSSSEHFGKGKYTLPFRHLVNRVVTVLTMLSSLSFQLWSRKQTNLWNGIQKLKSSQPNVLRTGNTNASTTNNQTDMCRLDTRLDHVEKHTAIYNNKYHTCSIKCQVKKVACSHTVDRYSKRTDRH